MESPSSSSVSLSSKEYAVEKILQKRIGGDGKPEYFLKWLEYKDEDNSWEPEKNINAELVLAFEKELREKEKKKERKENVKRETDKDQPSKASASNMKRAPIPTDEPASRKRVKISGAPDKEKEDSCNSKGAKDKPKVSGFDRGLEAEEIIGASHENGEVKILIKWKGDNGVEMVPTSVARFKCPHLLIKFYEERFVIINSSTNKNNK